MTTALKPLHSLMKLSLSGPNIMAHINVHPFYMQCHTRLRFFNMSVRNHISDKHVHQIHNSCFMVVILNSFNSSVKKYIGVWLIISKRKLIKVYILITQIKSNVAFLFFYV